MKKQLSMEMMEMVVWGSDELGVIMKMLSSMIMVEMATAVSSCGGVPVMIIGLCCC